MQVVCYTPNIIYGVVHVHIEVKAKNWPNPKGYPFSISCLIQNIKKDVG